MHPRLVGFNTEKLLVFTLNAKQPDMMSAVPPSFTRLCASVLRIFLACVTPP
jgi:hypothetical protein